MTDPSRLTAAGRVRVRPAGEADDLLAQALYVAMVERLLPNWGLVEAKERFREVYRRDQSWILAYGAEDVGWLQIEDTPDRITLRQLHLVPAHRGQGVGSSLVNELLGQAEAEGKLVVLRVVKGNPALAFYARLGFALVGEDDLRLWMCWRPAPNRPPIDTNR